jgi:hypothetical protein
MVPVVMEPGMTNPRDWKGELGAALGTKLFVDLSSGDDAVFKAACDKLYSDICVILKTQNPRRVLPHEEMNAPPAPMPVISATGGAAFDGAPGSVIVQGGSGPREHFVNGVYEPTEELCNNMPVYRRKDKPDYWLECCQQGSMWKWYIKLTEYRGPLTLTSYGYCRCSGNLHTVCLPQDCVANDWSISTGNGFVHQPEVVVKRDVSREIPPFLLKRLNTCQSSIQEMLSRPAKSGAVVITGATGAREHMVNGTYEPTNELCTGMPVYKNKDTEDFWLECCMTGSTYKWYIKQTEYRGPKCLTSYGYVPCSTKTSEVGLPQDSVPGEWNVSTGQGEYDEIPSVGIVALSIFVAVSCRLFFL